MRIRNRLLKTFGLLFLAILPTACVLAQNTTKKPARILFLLDGSSSMLNPWEDSTERFHTAARIIGRLTDSIYRVNPDVAFALRVYGTQYPAQDKNCYDTELEVPFGPRNAEQIQTRLKYLSARGYSPIAWSLEQAAQLDFERSDIYAYSIILITDGGESCGGDICATVEKLLAKKISFQPYILSLVDYAPLREEYACLGKFLTVAQEVDIASAVNVIINDNRIILQEGTNTPYVPIRPAPKQDRLPPPARPEVPQTVSQSASPKPVAVRPVPHHYQKMSVRTKPSRFNVLFAHRVPRPIKLPTSLSLQIPMEEIAAPPTPTVTTTPAPSRPAANSPRVSTQPTPQSVTVPMNRVPVDRRTTEDNLKFSQSSIQAKDTRLQVLFTNGKGKYYSTEPKMEFRDVGTQKVVKTAYRNMMGGQPDPIALSAGTYDIHIPGSKAVAKNVQVLANQMNTVTITVGGGSIAFYYPTAPKRPVIEYTALVSKRFEGGTVVKQACDTELPYDPTNYHIEINTLPPLVYNVDVGFNEVKLIAIPEAGTLEITNTELLGKVQLWFQMGDAFVPFHELVLTGNVAAQSVSVRPGHYQVRYYRHGTKPPDDPAVIKFTVKSNHTTQVTLVP